MAFTRRSLGALGLSEEQVDKVMALHGTSLSLIHISEPTRPIRIA